MAFAIFDRVKETSTSTGTGNLTLAGALSGKHRAFSAVYANNDTFPYEIEHQSADEWESGHGTFVSATPAIARTKVNESSNSNNAVNFSAGTKHIWVGPAAKLSVVQGFGTAFPGTPYTGLRFYRTDLKLEFTYDGTRWLSTQLFRVDLVRQTGVPITAYSASASDTHYNSHPLIGGFDFYIESLHAFVLVNPTQSGTQYWQLNLDTGAANDVATLTTQSLGSNIFLYLSATSIGAIVTAAAAYMNIDVVKVSTVGNLTILSDPWVYGRMIGT